MGGPGSGGSRTLDARPRVEDSLSLHVTTLGRELANAGQWRWVGWSRGDEAPGDRINVYVGEDGVQLVYSVTARGGEPQDVTEDVGVEWTPCPYGGRRPWWLCPGCGRRCGVLHTVAGRFRCRLCLGLAYASQVEKPHWRANRAAWKLRARLGARSRRDLGRPKGMHVRTYLRLLTRIEELDRSMWGGVRAWIDAVEAQRERRWAALGQRP